MRQIVLDTETTGLSPTQGHRVIEIGCVEIINRQLTGKHFHYYLNPDRAIDRGAQRVHGISAKFLQDKPRFEDIASAFLEYVRDADIIIHNAPFDISFLNAELKRLGAKYATMAKHCLKVTDSLTMARRKHPGQQNSLDALCKRYSIDHFNRELHGALLDSEILAQVYLAMTGGQTTMFSDQEQQKAQHEQAVVTTKQQIDLPVIFANETELTSHQQQLANMEAVDAELWSA